MRNPYLLGANDIASGYTNIIDVEKKHQYKCISCQSDLLLRKGEKRFQSLIHINKNGCQYFKNPTYKQLIEDAYLHLSKLIELDKVNILRRCKICKMPFKMEFNIDNVKLYFKKNGHDNNDNNDDNNDNDNNLKQYYYVDIEQLIKNIRMDFTTKKVELYCSYFTTCQECKIKYNL
jgi:hypothetical protein